MKKTILAGLALAVLAVPALAALTSGLKPGGQITPFHPKHISGPLAGTDKCFPCTYQQRPQVQVWVNGDDMKNVALIAKNLDDQMAAHKGKEFKAMVVLLADGNEAQLTEKSKKIVEKHSLKHVAIAVLPKTHEAVKAYEINTSGDIKNTVLAYKAWKVHANMVNLKADEKGLVAVNDAIVSLAK